MGTLPKFADTWAGGLSQQRPGKEPLPWASVNCGSIPNTLPRVALLEFAK